MKNVGKKKTMLRSHRAHEVIQILFLLFQQQENMRIFHL